MNHMIIGQGEIGKAVKKLLQEHLSDQVYCYDIKGGPDRVPPAEIAILHICFPYTGEEFIASVREYIVRYQPTHVMVWSTVQIGTCRQIKHNVVHSPVEGKHPKLYDSIKLMTRWLGSTSPQELNFFANYFDSFGLLTRKVQNPEATEALKLLSTTKYGLNIVFADYVERILSDIGADYELAKLWDKDYNLLYKALRMPQFQKFILDPPQGHIGGHCVRENAQILSDYLDDDILDLILETEGSNGKGES